MDSNGISCILINSSDGMSTFIVISLGSLKTLIRDTVIAIGPVSALPH